MCAAKIWNVYEVGTDKAVFTGTRYEVAYFFGMPALATNSDRLYPGRVYQRKWTVEEVKDVLAEIRKKHMKKQEPLPEWANGDRSFYNSVLEIKSTLLMSGTCGLGYTEDGRRFIDPLKALGIDVIVTKKKRIDNKGYFDLLEMVR